MLLLDGGAARGVVEIGRVVKREDPARIAYDRHLRSRAASSRSSLRRVEISVRPLLNIPIPFGSGGGLALANLRSTTRINSARVVRLRSAMPFRASAVSSSM